MLVLTRKIGERIVISDSIILEVVEIQGNRVRLGLQAPPDVTILRQELLDAPVKVSSTTGNNQLTSVS